MGIIVLQSETGSALVYVGFIFMLYREGLSGWLIFMIGMAILLFILTLTSSSYTALLVLSGLCSFCMMLYSGRGKWWLFIGVPVIILLAFVLSLPANELLIPIVLMTMSGTGSLQGIGAGDAASVLAHWSCEMLVCTMIFTLFHWPCATTIVTAYKETQSYKKTAAAIILPTAVGVMLCVVLHFLFQYLGG